MKKNMTFHKRKIWVVLLCCILMMTGLIGRPVSYTHLDVYKRQDGFSGRFQIILCGFFMGIL